MLLCRSGLEDTSRSFFNLLLRAGRRRTGGENEFPVPNNTFCAFSFGLGDRFVNEAEGFSCRVVGEFVGCFWDCRFRRC